MATTLTTLQVIHRIASSPDIKNVVIADLDDKSPMQAIESLSGSFPDERWLMNTSLEAGTMLLYFPS